MCRSIHRLTKSALVNTHELYQTKNILAQTEVAQLTGTFKTTKYKEGKSPKGRGLLYTLHG
jgi:hypothetical protein